MTFNTTKISFFRYIKSVDFSKGLIMAFCVVTALTCLSIYGYKPLGIAMSIGTLLCAPCDVPGNTQHRLKGLLSALVLSAMVTLMGRYSAGMFYLHTALVCVLAFGIAFLAVYGFRASLVAFSVLLALVLSFASFPAEPIWQHVVFILAGGFYYMGVSSIYFYFHTSTQMDFKLGETAKLTAEFLDCRWELFQNKGSAKDIQQKQIKLQTALNEKHEELREILLSSRRKSGLSNSTRRKLLAFILFVDILELALSQPVDFEEAGRLQRKYPDTFNAMAEILALLSEALMRSSEFFKDKKKTGTLDELYQSLETFKKHLKEQENAIEKADFIKLNNFFGIETKQVAKVNSLFRVIEAIQLKNSVSLKSKKYKRFMTPVDYSWKTLTQNFTFSNSIFRHALRLSILFFISLMIGYFFEFQKSYWVLITLIVIMRPSYGLTKKRTKMRIVGTLIGAAVAILIVLLFSSPVIFSILAIVSIILGFSMIQENYAGAAAFITITVIMVYALLLPGAYEIIQYRIVDTIIGAALAVLGNQFLFPAWEYRNIPAVKRESIEANRDFLLEIEKFYRKKGNLPLSYKLARKKAFLKLGELSAACQRMSQEPDSKQVAFAELYDFTTLSHTILSSLASLGTFIRNNPTTEASAAFESFTRKICQELNSSLDGDPGIELLNHDQMQNQIEDWQSGNYISENPDIDVKDLNEVQLIYDQLDWLYKLAVQLKAKPFRT